MVAWPQGGGPGEQGGVQLSPCALEGGGGVGCSTGTKPLSLASAPPPGGRLQVRPSRACTCLPAEAP